MNEDKIIKKLIEHDGHFKRLDKKLIEHDERLERIEENMVTKLEHNEVIDTLDKIMTILKRLDQERIFTKEWIKRIDKKVEKHDQDIAQIKEVLKI